jgi:hypothetical protein
MAQSQNMFTFCEGITLKLVYENQFLHATHPLISHKPLFKLFLSTEHSHGSPKLKISGVFSRLTWTTLKSKPEKFFCYKIYYICIVY